MVGEDEEIADAVLLGAADGLADREIAEGGDGFVEAVGECLQGGVVGEELLGRETGADAFEALGGGFEELGVDLVEFEEGAAVGGEHALGAGELLEDAARSGRKLVGGDLAGFGLGLAALVDGGKRREDEAVPDSWVDGDNLGLHGGFRGGAEGDGDFDGGRFVEHAAEFGADLSGGEDLGEEAEVDRLGAAEEDGALAGGVEGGLLGFEFGEVEFIPRDDDGCALGGGDHDEAFGAGFPDAGELDGATVGTGEFDGFGRDGEGGSEGEGGGERDVAEVHEQLRGEGQGCGRVLATGAFGKCSTGVGWVRRAKSRKSDV